MITLLAVAVATPTLHLAAVGDVMLDRYVGRALDKHGNGYALDKVRPLLNADLVVANLECPLTEQPKVLQKRHPFRAHPSRAAALKGIDLVSLANNHTLDCGRIGLTDTIRELDQQKIAHAGTTAYTLIERNGIRLAFVAYSDFPESMPGSSPKVNYYDSAVAAVRAAEQVADVVVVLPHWGIENSAKVSERQRQQARELSKAGADLILGSHPHVLQPVERMGSTVVAYSMGNFVFDSNKPPQNKTAVFRFVVSKLGVQSWSISPCLIREHRPSPSSPPRRAGSLDSRIDATESVSRP